MNMNLRAEYSNLNNYLRRLYDKFIEPHRDKFEGPEEYDLDLKSYCTLTHAAFEEFIENICTYLATEMIDNMNTTGRISWCTLCFFSFQIDKLSLNEKDFVPSGKTDDVLFQKLRTKANEGYKHFLDEIKNNHGINIKYLLHLLPAVGLNLPDNSLKVNSLKKLADSRGEYAHHYSIADVTKIISLDDAKGYVDDVKEIVEELYNKALGMYYFSSGYH